MAILLALLVPAFAAAPASAATPATPSWSVRSLAVPTNFEPGDESGFNRYEAVIINNGGAQTDQSPITITDTLPAGLTVVKAELRLVQPNTGQPVDFGTSACEIDTVGATSTVTCTIDESIPGAITPALLFPTDEILMAVKVAVPPSASGALTNHVRVEGGSAATATAESTNFASDEEASAGFEQYGFEATEADGSPTTGAGRHTNFFTTSFAVNLERSGPVSNLPFVPAGGDLKEIEVTLPPGFVGNPTATERCTAQQFNTVHAQQTPRGNQYLNDCPDASAVGVAMIQQLEGEAVINPLPIYNLEPPKGMPAQLGFQIVGLPIYINTRLRSGSDYGITAFVKNTSEAKRVTAASFMIWGVPGLERHDRIRGYCLLTGGACPVEDEQPFMRLPTQCDNPLLSSMSFETWARPPAGAGATDTDPAPTDCDLPPFEPTIEARPTTNVADAPSGLHFNLHLPQKENEDPEGLGHADLEDATVTLPEGFVVNPSSADGLDACSLSQIGYTGIKEGRHSFSADSPQCPDASKVGNVSVETPLVDHPLPGAVYLATPHQNPFDNLITIYISIDDPQTGVVVKLAGKVEANPSTGQLTTTVEQNPQVPFEDFTFDFFEGSRAPLRTPSVCVTHTTRATLTPWSAPAGSTALPSSSFETTVPSAGQGSCPSGASQLPNDPSFEAGTRAPLAGSYQPFSLRLSRQDGSQELKGLDLTLPPGLTGKLAGLSYCSDGALAGASSKPGRSEQASPSCPDSSRLGTVTVGAGAGPAPYYAKGTAYLAGPYKGAPISMSVITPAVAGPFDLGTVVVRAALQVDPETARIKAMSDPLPTILEGIPLDVRSIALEIDRDRFTLNPTSCDPFAFSGQSFSSFNQSAALSQRFQVGGCGELAFKPKLSLRLKGGTRRGDHPQLTATLRMPPNGANVAKAAVALPRSEFLDQANIRTVCTRVQFKADACPRGSIYGRAKAWTPLLDQPISGPVYLRSSDNLLPDLVADLDGQINVVLHGRTDSVRGGIRNTFEGIPDAPASKFVLTLKGGKRGLLVNSRNICAKRNKAVATFTAQSGKVSRFRPVLKAKCGGKGRKRGHRR